MIWTVASNLVSAGCQWGMVVAIAKLGTTAMVGQYAFALAVVAPLILFSNLQLRAIQATDVQGRFRFGDYLGLRISATAVACIVIAVLVFAGSYRAPTALAILGLTLSKSVEGISDIFYGFLQHKERMDYIARSTMMRLPLSLAVLTVSVYSAHSVFVGTLGMAGVSCLVLVAYDIPVSARLAHQSQRTQPANAPSSFWPEWKGKAIKALVWTAVPLGYVMCLISLQTNIPRYFIERSLGERQVGIFAALAYVIASGNIVVEALGQSVTPRLARMYEERDLRGFRHLLLRLSALGALGGCVALMGGWLAGRQLLSSLYRPEYVSRMDVFLILLASAGPTYVASFFGYALTAARLFWVQLPMSGLATASVALACFWLVPTAGLTGAAEAVLIVSIVRLIAAALIVMKASRPSSAATAA